MLINYQVAALLLLGSASQAKPDEPASPAPTPFILQPAEDKYSSEVARAEAVVAKAEEGLANAKRIAGEARLKAYQDRLKEVTKAGDFDKAIAVKARIEQLEKEPTSDSVKRQRPKDTIKFGSHTYALIKDQVTWHVAKRRCEEMGGKLACVRNAREDQFIGQLCGKTNAWVGATDEEDEGKWSNVDGSKPAFSKVLIDNAATGEHWMEWDGVSGHFNDINTNVRIAFVCEWEH